MRRRAAAVLLALALSACGGAPEVPHTIASVDDASCATCHAPEPAGSAAAPHPERAGCVSCHAPAGQGEAVDLLP